MGQDDHSAIEFMADRFGITREEAYKLYSEEQEELGHDVPGTMPPAWRESRQAYQLSSSQKLTWFDLSTEHSLNYIDKNIGPEIYVTCGVRAVDLSHLQADERLLTTLIATRLRNLMLHDGSFADGIRFTSRHGIGTCWAFWMRRTDAVLDNELVISDDGVPIDIDDPDLLEVTQRFGIRAS